MNDQIFGEHTEDQVNETNQTPNTPVLASLVYGTPLGGAVPAVIPAPVGLEEPVIDEPLIDEPIVDQIPASEPVHYDAPVNNPITPPAGSNIELSPTALLTHQDAEQLRARWNEIQGKFVDEPRAAVQQADALVLDVIENIAQLFANERAALEGQWKQGDDVSTEDLRKTLQRYRSFFNRLVI